MRVIAGDYKGRKLEVPDNNDIRPTGEKVKEAIFSILYPYLDGAICVDLFSGTGGLGIEALSRGADYCYFCDNSRDSINLTKRNIEKCNAEEYSKVIMGDYMKALRKIDGKVDIFLLDPPYHKGLYIKALNGIESLDLLSDEGIILVEHPKSEVLPSSLGYLHKTKERIYGQTVLSIYER